MVLLPRKLPVARRTPIPDTITQGKFPSRRLPGADFPVKRPFQQPAGHHTVAVAADPPPPGRVPLQRHGAQPLKHAVVAAAAAAALRRQHHLRKVPDLGPSAGLQVAGAHDHGRVDAHHRALLPLAVPRH